MVDWEGSNVVMCPCELRAPFIDESALSWEKGGGGKVCEVEWMAGAAIGKGGQRYRLFRSGKTENISIYKT